MLHLRVRIAVMLRQLLEFSCIIQTTLIVQDNGMCIVEKSNTEEGAVWGRPLPLSIPAKAQGMRGRAASKTGEGANLSYVDRRDLAKSGPSEALRIAKSS